MQSFHLDFATSRERFRFFESAPSILGALVVFLSASCQSADQPASQSGDPSAVHSAVPTASTGASQAFKDKPHADPARLLADVTWLADDAREGRGAGTEAALEAGRWIAARMEELRLEPAGEHGFLQEFAVPLPPRDGGNSLLVFQSMADLPPSWEAPDIAPLSCSEGAETSGRLVFAGYGIEKPEAGLRDYDGIDCSGAVVLVVRGAPPAEGSQGGAEPVEADPHASGSRTRFGASATVLHKVTAAKQHGAAAVLIAQHPDSDEPMLAFDAVRSGPAGLPAMAITAEVAERLIRGYSQSVRAFDAALREHWSSGGEGGPAPLSGAYGASTYSMRVHSDVVRETGPATNVLGRLAGKDRSRTVVIGAHYDHLGRGGSGSLAPDDAGEIHNGADDNASGTAAVLEVARLMSQSEMPACNVLFALWSGEELGLLGSDWWAKHPTVPLDGVQCNLNLDMVGRADAGKLQVLGVGTSPDFAAWVEEAGKTVGLETVASASGQGIGGSDHQTFLERGIPAVHLFSGVHSDYHRPSDDVERFEKDGAARVAEFSTILVRRMAATPELAFVQAQVPATAASPGATSRTWFGSVPDYAGNVKGMLLAGTSPGGPAEKAGLTRGDVIVQVGDVKVENIYDFMYALQVLQPGDVVATKYLRGGREEEVQVTLATREVE